MQPVAVQTWKVSAKHPATFWKGNLLMVPMTFWTLECPVFKVKKVMFCVWSISWSACATGSHCSATTGGWLGTHLISLTWYAGEIMDGDKTTYSVTLRNSPQRVIQCYLIVNWCEYHNYRCCPWPTPPDGKPDCVFIGVGEHGWWIYVTRLDEWKPNDLSNSQR